MASETEISRKVLQELMQEMDKKDRGQLKGIYKPEENPQPKQ